MLDRLLARAIVWCTCFILVTACLVWLGTKLITWQKPCPDYMCFWAAGKILASGRSPYDLDMQATVQHEYGWDKATDGLGFYDFLPYRYPPSLLGLISVVLVPLGFPTARMTWLAINTELLFLTGYMARSSMLSAGRWMPLAIVPSFAFSVLAVLVGQLSPLILFLVVATWRLLESRWDRSAGCLLAWITIKPQLSLIPLLAILLWSIRQRRWQVIGGFVAGLLPLLALSTWIDPTWMVRLFQSSSELPLVTVQYPRVGTTWILVLRSIGLSNPMVWIGYLALAIPAILWTLRAAWDRASSLAEVLALSILATFFVAPYARIYDLPILVVPLIVLIEGRLQKLWVSGLLIVFVVLPYVHFIYWIPPGDSFAPHFWFFWIPALLTCCWMILESKKAKE